MFVADQELSEVDSCEAGFIDHASRARYRLPASASAD